MKTTPINRYIPSVIIEDATVQSKLKEEQDKLLSWKTSSDVELNLTKELFKLTSCDTYIDLGCWSGVDSYLFYKDINPKKMILIDAVPTYLQAAKNLFTNAGTCDNVYISELLVLLRQNTETWPGYFTVDINSTSNSSTVQGHPNAYWIKGKETCNMPTTPRVISVSNVANVFFEEVSNSRCFLKTDIDSNDPYFWKEMLNSGVRPVVIKAEMFTQSDKEKLLMYEFLDICKKAGYKTPPPEAWLIENSALTNIFISKHRWACQNFRESSDGKIVNGQYAFTSKNY
jgi:hypothetical protein